MTETQQPLPFLPGLAAPRQKSVESDRCRFPGPDPNLIYLGPLGPQPGLFQGTSLAPAGGLEPSLTVKVDLLHNVLGLNALFLATDEDLA